jgi:hypothetical protein
MTQIEDAVRSFNGLAETTTFDSAAAIDRAAAIAGVVFRDGINSGLEARDVVGRLGPGISRMREARDRLGLSVGDTAVSLISFHSLVTSNAIVEDAIAELEGTIDRLSREGAMAPETP